MNIQTTLTGLLIAIPILFSSCSDDDDNNVSADTTTSLYNNGPFFIATKTDDNSEWVIQTNSLTQDLSQANNMMELPQTEYTWIFKNDVALGFVYNQQNAGIGYALRYTDANSQFSKMGAFSITTRYSTYGFFNNQLVTSVAGQTYTDSLGESHNDGATFAFWNISGAQVELDHTKTIATEPIAANGEQITFSGIVDNGDGTFLTAFVESNFHQTGTGNGSSVGDIAYPDSVWVAQMDADLNVLKVFRDDRISYAAGQYRSQVFTSLFKVEDGTVYAFSNSLYGFSDAYDSSTALKAGALRILSGADDFDKNYYFDLQTPANGYRFRRVWHMVDHIFLLEIYNDYSITTISVGHQFAVVDMENQTFTSVTGLPAKNLITSGTETGGVPMYHDGTIYLPITEFGNDAAIYAINPSTAEATKQFTITGATEIRTIGTLTN